MACVDSEALRLQGIRENFHLENDSTSTPISLAKQHCQSQCFCIAVSNQHVYSLNNFHGQNFLQLYTEISLTTSLRKLYRNSGDITLMLLQHETQGKFQYYSILWEHNLSATLPILLIFLLRIIKPFFQPVEMFKWSLKTPCNRQFGSNKLTNNQFISY